MKNDGISVIALVIALLLLSSVGFVFSSLIITKQKSAHLPLKSTQAFYAAQAGIEYAIRYASDHQSDFWTDPDSLFSLMTDKLKSKGFDVTLTYDKGESITGDESITSKGKVGTAEREITLASFLCYVTGGWITLDPDNPPDSPGDKKITIPICNNTGGTLYIFQIDMAKDLEGKLKEIKFDKTKVYKTPKHEKDIDIDSNPTQIDFSIKPYYYNLLTGSTTSNEFKFDDKVAVDTYTVIYHYYFEGGSEADNYTSELKFTIP